MSDYATELLRRQLQGEKHPLVQLPWAGLYAFDAFQFIWPTIRGRLAVETCLAVCYTRSPQAATLVSSEPW